MPPIVLARLSSALLLLAPLVARAEPGNDWSVIPAPAAGPARVVGGVAHGCLAGAVRLPDDGPGYQVIRLSRHRDFGHPELVAFIARLGRKAQAAGLQPFYVGDMAQPRGGPLPFGHASHQIGLDVDIWFMPMPNHELSKKEREDISAIDLVAPDRLRVDPKNWTPADVAFIKTAAEQPEVERVFVNAAIKKEICRVEDKQKHAWLEKVRPWYGHADHIHVRLKCPADSPNCRKQEPVPAGDGCAEKDLAFWFKDSVLHPKPGPPPKVPPKPITLADLPPACKTVLDAPANPKAAAQ